MHSGDERWVAPTLGSEPGAVGEIAGSPSKEDVVVVGDADWNRDSHPQLQTDYPDQEQTAAQQTHRRYAQNRKAVPAASPTVDFRSLDVWSGRVGERVE